MARVKAPLSLVLITVVTMGVLRAAHVGIPLVFPATRQGALTLASLDDLRPLSGFAALVPAYRPALLGDRPVSMTFAYHPHPTFVTAWKTADGYLTVTQQQGGPMPAHPPLAQPMNGVPGSVWWTEGGRSQAILPHGEFWVHIDTSLPERELVRFAETLTPYR